MAKVVIGAEIKVDGLDAAGQSVGSFKKQLREAQGELVAMADKFGLASKEAQDAAKKVAGLKDSIGDAKDLAETFNPDKKFVALGGAIQGVVAGFMKVLKKNNQLKMAGKIIEKFNGIYNQKNGIVEAEVTSREALDKDVSNKLRNYVSTKYKAKEVVIKNKIDENIKGGIIIKVGDEIIDASLKSRLINLNKLLKV